MTNASQIKTALLAWANGDLTQSAPSCYASGRDILRDAIRYETGDYDCPDEEQRVKAIRSIEAFCESDIVSEYITSEVATAVTRSTAYHEIVAVEYDGTLDQLLADCREIAGSLDIDHVTRDDGVIDVWAYDPATDGDETEWRIAVRLS